MDCGAVRVTRFGLGSVLGLCLAGALVGCGGVQTKSSTTLGAAAAKHSSQSAACKPNPRDGVYHPDRLEILNPCARFQGTVVEAPKKFPDGDVSFLVAPDPGYASMLNAQNRKEGGLHVEIVPRDQPGCTPGQPLHVGDVPVGLCSGRDIADPALGAHVRIIGPWVLDRNNDWNEIHPTWKITAVSANS